MSDEKEKAGSETASLSASEDSDSGDSIRIRISHVGRLFDFLLDPNATMAELMDEIEEFLDIPIKNQKIIAPKHALIKAPLKNPDQPLREFEGKKLMLMGSTAATANAVQEMAKKVARRNAARMAQAQKAKKRKHRPILSQEDSTYTFQAVRAMQGLPHPQRSQQLLMRLKQDPGIMAAMKKHKFTVALLTEMEPLSNTQTTHEGTTRLLGLNRNKGEVIELRLRTDAHDGYRDYKTIRKTLCHELAHNVHGPHDRKFWDLCHQIEREVEAADWKSSGHTLGESSRYAISGQEQEEDIHEDEGGWEGGEYVLGGISLSSSELSRREILAKAAEERQRKQNEENRKDLERQRNARGL